MNSITKKCTGCGETKEISEFYKQKSQKSGLAPRCKECTKKQVYSYVSNNREKVYESLRRYKRANPEKVALRHKNYQEKHKEKVKSYKQNWYTKNIDKIKKRFHENYILNSDKAKERAKNWRADNPERYQLRKQRYYQENKDKIYESVHLWRKENRDKERQFGKNRRARKKGASGNFTATEWETLKKKYNYTCLKCKRREPDITLEQDHVLPLISGGSNSIDNIQPLCRSCNASKSTKHIDYRPENGRKV